MRKIKFRAWHKEAREYCEGTTANMFRWLEDGQPIILEQCTGLKDKNGVEIYEGDILNSTSYIGGNYLDTLTDKVVVSFQDYKWAIQPVKRSLLRPQPITELEDDCEVIGNIYENPELLEK